MTGRAIIFSAPMVRAILEGRKTMTRRLAKEVPMGRMREGDVLMSWPADKFVREGLAFRPPCRVGDRLWVREGLLQTGKGLEYIADETPVVRPQVAWNWTFHREKIPSIHMPRWASRITLEVTAVRVQRLQEISEDEAEAEGVEEVGQCTWWDYVSGGKGPSHVVLSPRESFRTLWESIHGPGAWEANPWVCAVTFKREETKP